MERSGPAFHPEALLGGVLFSASNLLPSSFVLIRYLSDVAGACGFPYEGRDVATSEKVFVKILTGGAWAVQREVATAERLLSQKLSHQFLAHLRCCIPDGVVELARGGGRLAATLPALVSDFYEAGDLFTILFRPQLNQVAEQPRGLPEPVARHVFAQLVSALSHLHLHGFYHRDLKPENVLFDDAFNVKLSDLGSIIFAPTGDAQLPARALTGLYPLPVHSWRIGTEAYAPPESHRLDGYDPASFDIWSLGVVLFVLLHVDALSIVYSPHTHGGTPLVRMPFIDHQAVVFKNSDGSLLEGSCPSMSSLLDVPPASYTGSLEDPCVDNNAFWAQLPAARHLPDARDLLNRCLVVDPAKRITLDELKRHPWLLGGLATTVDIQSEMAARSQHHMQGDVEPVRLQPNCLTMAQLRRWLAQGDNAANVPSDSDLASHVMRTGILVSGGNGNEAAHLFTFLSSSIANKAPDAVQALKTRFLRLEVSTASATGTLEQFSCQVEVFDDELVVVIIPGVLATEFVVWHERLVQFCANWRALKHTAAGLAGRPCPPAPPRVGERRGREPAATSPSQRARHGSPPPPPPPLVRSSSSLESGGAVSALDWTWTPLGADRELYEGLWKQGGFTADSTLLRVSFARFTAQWGYNADVVNAVWTLVCPPPEGHMRREAFVKALYLLRRFADGCPLPPAFPEHALATSAPQNSRAREDGSREHPIRYDQFAFAFRPVLEAAYRSRPAVFRKTSPVAVLCSSLRSPFGPGPSGPAERFVCLNMAAQNGDAPPYELDSYGVKESNFQDAYSPSAADDPVPVEALDATDGACSSLKAALSSAFGTPHGSLAWPDAHWAALRAFMRSEQAASVAAPKAWHFAKPNSHVVAVCLTEEVVRRAMNLLRITCRPVLFREETHSPSVPFRVGDYLVGDVTPAASNVLFSPCVTHDQRWAWKQGNKIKRGQTLLTRTIDAKTFRSTFVALDP